MDDQNGPLAPPAEDDFDRPTGRDLRRIATAIGENQFGRGLLFGLGVCVAATAFFFVLWLVLFLFGALAWIALLSQAAGA